MGDVERALEDFEETIRLFPAYGEAIRNRDARSRQRWGSSDGGDRPFDAGLPALLRVRFLYDLIRRTGAAASGHR